MLASPFRLASLEMVALILAVTSLSPVLAARTVVECREADGTISYRDRCPPSISKVRERRLSNVERPPPTAAEIASRNPVVLYAIPDCDTCDLVRLQLQSRGIPFSEKNASDNPTVQEELKIAAGSVTVPTVVIGAKALSGYDRAALAERLSAAGYPAPPANPTTSVPPPTPIEP